LWNPRKRTTSDKHSGKSSAEDLIAYGIRSDARIGMGKTDLAKDEIRKAIKVRALQTKLPAS
jgi:hypothetical protein